MQTNMTPAPINGEDLLHDFMHEAKHQGVVPRAELELMQMSAYTPNNMFHYRPHVLLGAIARMCALQDGFDSRLCTAPFNGTHFTHVAQRALAQILNESLRPAKPRADCYNFTLSADMTPTCLTAEAKFAEILLELRDNKPTECQVVATRGAEGDIRPLLLTKAETVLSSYVLSRHIAVAGQEVPVGMILGHSEGSSWAVQATGITVRMVETARPYSQLPSRAMRLSMLGMAPAERRELVSDERYTGALRSYVSAEVLEFLETSGPDDVYRIVYDVVNGKKNTHR